MKYEKDYLEDRKWESIQERIKVISKDVIVGKSLGDMSLGEWRGLPGTGKQGWEVMGCKIGWMKGRARL